jgi:hypothetical protein
MDIRIKIMLKALCGLLLFMGPALAANDDLEEINFPLNSSVVVDGFQGLDLLADVMAKFPNLDLEVTGWTDSTGSVPYNKRLSLKRAERVKTYLVTKGAPESQIKASGDGIAKSHDNTTREGRFQNRHVALTLYETNSGVRSKVPYRRMLEMFFGKSDKVKELEKSVAAARADSDGVLKKLTELNDQLKAANEKLQKKISDLQISNDKAHADLQKSLEEHSKRMAMNVKIGKYMGVSLGGGVDDDGEFAAQLRGLYFRKVADRFAVQAQGDFSYYDEIDDGQIDAALIYQNEKGFKLAAAASYKWASIAGLDTARIGQAAVIADWRFGSGKFGLFGTYPFADGDVLGTVQDGAYSVETYVSVPSQVGIDVGFSVGEKVDVTGYVSSLDTERSDADLSAGLRLNVLVTDNATWFLEAEQNQSYLYLQDDARRYLTGIRLGSWNHARYNVTEGITPVNIPKVHYELLTRRVRTGNTAPTANAGASRTDVPAGTVTLTGSGSDPDGDAITYKWTQTAGTPVELSGADSATASFTGVAGEAYVFQLTVRDSIGESGTDIVSIGMEAAPIPEPTILNFLATPSSIDDGQISTLSWATEWADDISISGIGAVGPAGNVPVDPSATTTYVLTASNETATVTAEVTVTVIPLPTPAPEINFFSAVPGEILEGEFTTLAWSTKYADSVVIDGLGQVSAEGSLIISPRETVTYNMVATNEYGEASASVTVTVTPLEPPNTTPIADAGVDQTLVIPGVASLDGSASFDPDGDTLTYSWTQIGGPTAEITGADTATPSVTLNGKGQTYTFRLTVNDGRGGYATDTVSVYVVDFR